MKIDFINIKNRIKEINFVGTYKSVSKPLRIFGIVTLCSLVLAIVFSAMYNSAANAIEEQHIAETWSGDSDVAYSQISLFLPESADLQISAIKEFEQKADDAVSDTLPETVVNVYADCYSSKGSLKITGDHGSTDVNVTAVGGDYFVMHPFKLVSGSFFSDEDVMHDRLVITKELAWLLFGSIDVAGMEVSIDSQPFKIAGVIECESDRFTSRTLTDLNLCYMSYDTFSTMTGSTLPSNDSDSTDLQTVSETTDAHISTYEIVMPNPVSGFAKSLVTSELNSDSKGIVVDNTARYDKEIIFNELKNFGLRTLRTDTVEFPYYENAARLSENSCILYLLLNMIFLICPIVFAVYVIVIGYKTMKRLIRKKFENIKNQYEERKLFKTWKGKHTDG